MADEQPTFLVIDDHDSKIRLSSPLWPGQASLTEPSAGDRRLIGCEQGDDTTRPCPGCSELLPIYQVFCLTCQLLNPS